MSAALPAPGRPDPVTQSGGSGSGFRDGNVRTPTDFQNSTGVSRETLDALVTYAALLEKWQKRINLVGPRTVADLWSRHFLDSAQLVSLIPPGAKRLVDLGSGAGFPGLVLCILTGLETHLIESDTRKCAFLREAGRAAGVSSRLTVHARRAESIELPPADVISARALAPLPDLLALAAPFWGAETQGLFLKGKRYEEELTAAKYGWYINYSTIPSRVDPESVILSITGLRQAPGADPEGEGAGRKG